MAFLGCYILVGLLVLVGSLSNSIGVTPSHDASSLSRSSFPRGFIFGSASAAYQYEGAANEDGRGPSIWDTYTHRYPDRIADHSNGDVAIDQYHYYKEDVELMKEIGLDVYRFSISWSRVLPSKIISLHQFLLSVIKRNQGLGITHCGLVYSLFVIDGKLSGGVNSEGIKYYNNLINELLAKGIQPFVTLFHWDLPQALEDEYKGFLSPHIVDDFRDYSELCFKEFGDRVKHWITLNEPMSYSLGGYAVGILAPGRCSDWQHLNCSGGDSGTEPYLVTHNQLLAHATAVKVYKQKYQARQKGTIGITLVTTWMVPFSDARHHRNAALRALDFNFGWFMDPLTNGDYPHSMRSLVGNRLPKFSKEQSKIVNGSFDFIGLNYYTSRYAAYAPQLKAGNASYITDSLVNLLTDRNGIPIGPKAASDWLYVYPRGIRDLLLYTKTKYNNPVIYITENGIDEFNNATLRLEEALVDHHRIDYYSRHLWYLHRAIKDGVKVKGFFAWTLLDNFEWISGFTLRFGINYVDYKDGLKRYPKLSAHWFKDFLKKY